MGKKHLFLSLTTHNLLLLKRCSGKCSKVSCLGVLALVSESNRTRARTIVQITLKKKMCFLGVSLQSWLFFLLRSPLFLFPLSLGDIVLTAPRLPLRIFWSPVFRLVLPGGDWIFLLSAVTDSLKWNFRIPDPSLRVDRWEAEGEKCFWPCWLKFSWNSSKISVFMTFKQDTRGSFADHEV